MLFYQDFEAMSWLDAPLGHLGVAKLEVQSYETKYREN